MKYLRHASFDDARQALARLLRWLTLSLSMMASSASLHAGPVNVSTGWNLLGNSQSLQVNVADVFGTSNVTTVWKWDNATATWQFYAPSLSAATLPAYAASKGYGVLTVINPGEGVWVNAASSFTAVLPDGAPVAAYSFSAGQTNALQDGWNLVSTGSTITPSSFNSNLSATPPVAGTIANNFSALWTWDSAMSSWYFYAPSLESQGQTVSSSYVASKGYLDFATSGKTLGTGIGFWVARGLPMDVQPPAPGGSASTSTTTTAAPTTTTTAVATTTSTTLSSSNANCQVSVGGAVGYVTGVPSASYCINSLLNANGGGATVSQASIYGGLPAPGMTQLTWSSLSACDPLGAPPAAGATTLTPCRMTGGTTATTTTTTTTQTTQTTIPTVPTTTLIGNQVTCQLTVGSAIGYVTGVPTSAYCSASLINVSGGGAYVTLASLPMLTGKTQLAYSALAACDPLGAPPAAGATTLTPCTKNGTPPTNSGAQSISFVSVPAVVVNGNGLLSAIGGGSGNAVVFTSITPTLCSVSGNTVTGVLAGTCTIAANQAGNANYTAAPQATQTIVVGRGSQSINYGMLPSLKVGTVGSLSATGGPSGNAVLFTSNTPTVCTIADNGVTGITVGSCLITASQTGNENYEAAMATQIIAVDKGQQTISFGAHPFMVVDDTGLLIATGGASGNAVVLTSQTLGVCTVQENVVIGVTAGNCSIVANQAGNANYAAAAQATIDFSVSPGAQSISFGVAPVLAAYDKGSVNAIVTSVEISGEPPPD